MSHDRYEAHNNAASACLQSDKVIKRQMEMRDVGGRGARRRVEITEGP